MFHMTSQCLSLIRCHGHGAGMILSIPQTVLSVLNAMSSESMVSWHQLNLLM